MSRAGDDLTVDPRTPITPRWRRAPGTWPKTGQIWDRRSVRLCTLFGLLSVVALCDALDALTAGALDLLRVTIALGAALTSTMIAVALLRHARRRLTVDIDGLETRDRAGRLTRILWNEAHELRWVGVASSGGRVLCQRATICTADGRRIEVADARSRGVESAPSLSSLVRRLSTEAHYASVRRRLADGECVDFGPVRLSATMLQLADTSVSMHELGDRLTVRRGTIELTDRARSRLCARIPIRRVPHAPSLFRALEALTELAPDHTGAQRVLAVMEWSGGRPIHSYS